MSIGEGFADMKAEYLYIPFLREGGGRGGGVFFSFLSLFLVCFSGV